MCARLLNHVNNHCWKYYNGQMLIHYFLNKVHFPPFHSQLFCFQCIQIMLRFQAFKVRNNTLFYFKCGFIFYFIYIYFYWIYIYIFQHLHHFHHLISLIKRPCNLMEIFCVSLGFSSVVGSGIGILPTFSLFSFSVILFLVHWNNFTVSGV